MTKTYSLKFITHALKFYADYEWSAARSNWTIEEFAKEWQPTYKHVSTLEMLELAPSFRQSFHLVTVSHPRYMPEDTLFHIFIRGSAENYIENDIDDYLGPEPDEYICLVKGQT